MNNTRKTIRTIAVAATLGLAVTSLTPLSAQAWGRGGQSPSPERAVQRLAWELGLTPEQQEQAQKILEESFARREELRKIHLEQANALWDQTHESLSAVLGPDQAAKLDALWEARREWQERRAGGDWEPGFRGGKGAWRR